ncbi:Cof-like hydrolase [Lactobacillus selangorensis]|uniref:Cof-like hydrolase n=1 Tax=Lactobacillus selangorensis TaxID=81857 RepID=A0A0R2FSJ3_9LACO|nr:HAD family hydrolase [Lactobacillus selangorensis]KRN28122.1 Cof-like hydrolase [Lactobacillus selangorensis]KRN31001.1 Cof-like hydrolase [Lactobacillus selangorensis]
MTIKHLFSDMDGTLLNSQGRLSDRNAEIIRDSKLPFTLVSARAPREMQGAIDKLGLRTEQIAFNGGLIFKPNGTDYEVIDQNPISLQTVWQILPLVRTHFPHVSVSFYDLQHWYTERVDRLIRFEEKLVQQSAAKISYADYFADPSRVVFKIMLITFDPDELAHLKTFMNGVGLQGVSIQQTGEAYLEITSQQAKKSRGIRYVLHQTHLEKAETAAFGDSYNDLPMFAEVGRAIVMNDALPAIKAQGDFITKSNDEDGVGYAIKHFINQGRR